MRHIATIASLFVAGCSSLQTQPPDRWHQLASQAHELTSTASGMAWERQMLPVHNAFWSGVTAACGPAAKAARITRFNAVAAIDSTGRITEFLAESPSPALDCFSKSMVGRTYPAPPTSPFFELYAVDLSPNN